MEKVKELEKRIPFRDKIAKAVGIFMPNWDRASVDQGAAEMAYFVLLSLLPILLVIANIIPMLPIPIDELLGFLQNVVPADIYNILAPTLMDYLESGSGGAITIGILAAIWSASKIINSLRTVLNKVYNTCEEKNFIINRILSMVIMLAMVMVTGLSVFIFVFGEQIIILIQSIIGMKIPFIGQFLAIRWVVLLLVLLLVFIILYQFVPDHHLSIRYTIPGAVFSTIGWLVLSQFFSIYASFAGGDATANATFGAFIVLMLFLYLSSLIILIGALVNVLFFEWINDKTVREYEKEIITEENLKKVGWTGYPNEKDEVILRKQIIKVQSLEQSEVDKLKTDNSNKKESDKKRAKDNED